MHPDDRNFTYESEFSMTRAAVALGHVCRGDECSGWHLSDFDVWMRCGCGAGDGTHPEDTYELDTLHEDYVDELRVTYLRLLGRLEAAGGDRSVLALLRADEEAGWARFQKLSDRAQDEWFASLDMLRWSFAPREAHKTSYLLDLVLVWEEDA